MDISTLPPDPYAYLPQVSSFVLQSNDARDGEPLDPKFAHSWSAGSRDRSRAPGSPLSRMAWHYHFARQYEQAIEQCWQTSELHPKSFWPAWFFGLAYEQQGQIDRAEEELQVAVKMSGDVTFASAALGHLYGIVGKTAQARSIFDELTARASRRYVPAYDIALVCAGLGWRDQALGYLSQAHQERSGWMTYINVDPRLDPLRDDPRFIDLLHRVHLINPA